MFHINFFSHAAVVVVVNFQSVINSIFTHFDIHRSLTHPSTSYGWNAHRGSRLSVNLKSLMLRYPPTILSHVIICIRYILTIKVVTMSINHFACVHCVSELVGGDKGEQKGFIL